MHKYYRITINNEGIYNALKKAIWAKSNNPKKDWTDLKNSLTFNWLKVPNIEYKNCKSYFTKIGFNTFMDLTYPIILKYFDESNINIEEFEEFFLIKNNIVYSDENQIIVSN